MPEDKTTDWVVALHDEDAEELHNFDAFMMTLVQGPTGRSESQDQNQKHQAGKAICHSLYPRIPVLGQQTLGQAPRNTT